MVENPEATTVGDDIVRETSTRTFVKDVIEESRRQPVLVDFWAPWCGPCKQFTPVLEKAVRAAKGKAKLVKMNIDEHPAIPGQMGIQSIPAVIAFVNGQPVDGFLGALPESQVTAFVKRTVGDVVLVSDAKRHEELVAMQRASLELLERGEQKVGASRFHTGSIVKTLNGAFIQAFKEGLVVFFSAFTGVGRAISDLHLSSTVHDIFAPKEGRR